MAVFGEGLRDAPADAKSPSTISVDKLQPHVKRQLSAKRLTWYLGTLLRYRHPSLHTGFLRPRLLRSLPRNRQRELLRMGLRPDGDPMHSARPDLRL